MRGVPLRLKLARSVEKGSIALARRIFLAVMASTRLPHEQAIPELLSETSCPAGKATQFRDDRL